MKKQILLTALTLTLLASAVMTAAAEEVVATILFEPEMSQNSYGLLYPTDSTGNGVVDRRLEVYLTRSQDPVYNTLIRYYLKQGVRFTFDDKGLRPFENILYGRLLAIEINGRMVELTELFPPETIKDYFQNLWEKLVREGRAR